MVKVGKGTRSGAKRKLRKEEEKKRRMEEIESQKRKADKTSDFLT